jgi:hypothetical protein
MGEGVMDSSELSSVMDVPGFQSGLADNAVAVFIRMNPIGY